VSVAGRTADVCFIHPTTYFGAAANARFDEPGVTRTRLEAGVPRFQASVFNACCRIYAPRCRQAALAAFLKADTTHATAAYELRRARRRCCGCSYRRHIAPHSGTAP